MSQQYYKFPRIYHAPWSKNLQNDDRLISSLDGFKDKEIVVSIKVDGENCNFYSDRIHARSPDSRDHISRHWVKQLHASIKHHIPKNWRITGENLFALHSLYYTKLESYFYVYAIFDEDNFCLDWGTTIDFAKFLGLSVVPVLYIGSYDEEKIKSLEIKTNAFKGWTPKENIKDFDEFRNLISSGKKIEEFANETQEGYVCRVLEPFHYNDFDKYIMKSVRKGHVQTSDFWMTQPIIPNKLREK